MYRYNRGDDDVVDADQEEDAEKDDLITDTEEGLEELSDDGLETEE